jgi:hypothetical protein
LYQADKQENIYMRNLKSRNHTSRNRRIPFMNERDFNAFIDANGII